MTPLAPPPRVAAHVSQLVVEMTLFGIGVDVCSTGRIPEPLADSDFLRLECRAAKDDLIVYKLKTLVDTFLAQRPLGLPQMGWLSKAPVAKGAQTRTNTPPMIEAHARAMFGHYFELHQGDIQTTFGQHNSWPAEWNFARVIRNSLLHAGEIHFTNANANPVSWKALSYSPADNGKKILHVDLTLGDLILLMIDLDASLP